MRNKKLKLTLTLLIMILLTSCGTASQPIMNDGSVRTDLIRSIDKEAGVVCWSFVNLQGIDCMPIEETRLNDER